MPTKLSTFFFFYLFYILKYNADLTDFLNAKKKFKIKFK